MKRFELIITDVSESFLENFEFNQSRKFIELFANEHFDKNIQKILKEMLTTLENKYQGKTFFLFDKITKELISA
jgi:hypothetical protein